MVDKHIPNGYQPLSRIGGFIEMAGPYFFRRRDAGDSPDVFHYGFQTGEAHHNSNGVIHGGALMTFADTAMGATVYFLAQRPCATISMTSEFVVAAKPGDWIDARVTIIRQTRSLTFARCTLEGGGAVVLNASGIWKLFPPNIPGHDKPSD